MKTEKIPGTVWVQIELYIMEYPLWKNKDVGIIYEMNIPSY